MAIKIRKTVIQSHTPPGFSRRFYFFSNFLKFIIAESVVALGLEPPLMIVESPD